MSLYLSAPEFADVVGIKQHSFSCVTFLSKNVQVNFSICVCLIHIPSVYQHIVFKDWKTMKLRSYQGTRLLQSYQQTLQYWRETRHLPGGVSSPGQIAGSSLMISMSSCSLDNHRSNRKTKVSSVSTLVNLTTFTFQDGFFSADFGMSSRRILQNLPTLRLAYNT